MLKHRLMFGLVMLAGALAIFWLDAWLPTLELEGVWRRLFFGRRNPPPGLALLGLFLVLLPIAAVELTNIFRASEIRMRSPLISIAALAAAITVYITPASLDAPTGVAIIASVLVACFIITLLWHSRRATVQGVIAAAGATMFAVAYLGLMAGFYLAMRRWHPAWVVLAVVLITKCGDIGAYFTGRAIGRHKLIPWLSPRKTWEGLAGGVALATLVAVGLAMLSQTTDLATVYRIIDGEPRPVVQRYHPGWAALAGVLLAAVGHMGDLIMSLFKRDAGVKDTGDIVPGFGGVLDVLDSPLLVAPVAYWMLELAAG